MEIDLLRMSLLAIGVVVLLIVYWFNRPRSKSSPPPESPREADPDEILGIDSPISAVDDPLESEDLRSELESLKRVIGDEETEIAQAERPEPRPAVRRIESEWPQEEARSVAEQTRDEPPIAEATLESMEEATEVETSAELEEKIVVLYLVARSPEGWQGERLFAAAESAGLSYGDLNIYHSIRDGESQFSMANLVEPGYFEPDRADGFTSPGVTFFLQLPGPSQPLQAFDDMVAAISHMAGALDGEPRGHDRRPISDEGFAALRRDIAEYEAAAVVSP